MSTTPKDNDAAVASTPAPDAAKDATSGAPTGFFYTEAHWTAIDGLTEALRDGRDATLLVGPVGVGKSSIVRQAIAEGPKTIHAVLASASKEGGDIGAFEKRLAGALAVDEAVRDAGSESEALRARLAQLASLNQRVALFVDHADRLSDEKLNALEALINAGKLDDGRSYGVQIVLIGPPSLQRRLEKGGAKAFRAAAKKALTLRLIRADEVEKFAEALTGDDFELSDTALDRIMDRTSGAPALLSPLLSRLANDASSREAGGAAAPTAEAVDTAADALALDCSPQALGLEPDEPTAQEDADDADAAVEPDDALEGAAQTIEAQEISAPEVEVDIDLDAPSKPPQEASQEALQKEPQGKPQEAEPLDASVSVEAFAETAADAAIEEQPLDPPTAASDELDDEALERELMSLGIDPIGDDAVPEVDEDRARPLAALRATPDDAPVARRAASPKRRRRRGLRLVDPAWLEKRNKALKVSGAVAAVGAAAFVGLSFVQSIDDAPVVDVASEASETAPAVEAPSAEETAAITNETKPEPAGPYERNRETVLDVMDGAFELAETAARRTATAAPGPVGDAATALASMVVEQQQTIKAGRILEAVADLPAEEAAKAIDERIEALAITATERFEAEQYTRPRGVSAYDAYLEIHRLAPGDQRSEDGFDHLLVRYKELADAALKESAFEEYYRLITVVDGIRARRPL